MTQLLCRRVRRAVHTTLLFCKPRKVKPDWWCGFLVTVHRKYRWQCPFLKRWTQPFTLLRKKSTPWGPGSAKPAAGKSSSRGEKWLWAATPRLMSHRDISWQNEDNQNYSTKITSTHPLLLPAFSTDVPLHPILLVSARRWESLQLQLLKAGIMFDLHLNKGKHIAPRPSNINPLLMQFTGRV